MDGICLDDATKNSALSVQNIICYKEKGDFIEVSLSLIRVIIYSTICVVKNYFQK